MNISDSPNDHLTVLDMKNHTYLMATLVGPNQGPSEIPDEPSTSEATQQTTAPPNAEGVETTELEVEIKSLEQHFGTMGFF